MNFFNEGKLLRKLEEARKSKDNEKIARLCRKLAVYYSDQGFYDKALDMYKEELKICETVKDREGVATANRMIGEMYCNLGTFEDSLKFIELYLKYSLDSRDKVEEQRAWMTMGRLYFCWAAHKMKTADDFGAYVKKCNDAFIKSLNICEKELRNISERERAEMKERSLYNLGLASELQGHRKTAQSYLLKAIQICKNENLTEDLVRGYIAQGEMHLKAGDFTAAHESFDSARSHSTSNEQTVVILLLKSEAYFLMCNYAGAKNILKKAYKLNPTNEIDKKTIEIKLKKAAILCDLEKKLSEINENDFEEREKLYEKHGDTCCDVKNFKHAVQSYLSMLDNAQKAGKSGKGLLPCYTSLSQTYKDDKQYDLALEYSKKELELLKDDLKETCRTYVSMAEILTLRGDTYEEISDLLYKAKDLAEDINDVDEKVNALKQLHSLQVKLKKTDLAEQTMKEISDLGWSADDGIDDSDLESENSPVDLHDVLTDSDDKEEFDRPRIRPPRCAFKFKRNEKGETPLHVACIKGDLNRAKKLIEQGHPVKVEDSAGWTPLHEACNHGWVDIVNLLLDSGADINDPGGSECKGITPLHDAASNGHFAIIDLLLKKGASTSVMTTNGETPQDYLKEWRDRSNLNEEDKTLYNKCFDMLKPSVKIVLNTKKDKRNNTQNVPLLTVDEPVKTFKKQKLNSVKDLRRNPDLDLDNRYREASPVKSNENFSDVEISNWSSDEEFKEKSATKEYKAAIEVFRKRQVNRPFQANKLKKNDSCLLNEEDVVDDWLEDDLRPNQPQKKRKTTNSLLDHDTIRNSTPKASTSKISIEDMQIEDSDDERRGDVVRENQSQRNATPSTRVPVQPSLERQNSRVLEAEFETIDATPRPNVQHTVTSSNSFQSNIYKVRVTVMDQRMLIPIQHSKMDELTIGWLTEEVAKRYYLLEGVEPIIRLKTADGAILSESDPLSLIYNEDLESSITGWKSMTLSDRYKEACSTLPAKNISSKFCRYQCNNNPDPHLISVLDACSTTKCLNLSDLALTCYELAPIFKILKYQKSIKSIDLSGNVLGDEGLNLLAECLEKCAIEDINISCNNLSNVGIHEFSEKLSKINQSLLDSIQTLDFSFNPIGDNSVNSLNILFGKMNNLKVVKTDFCDLTKSLNVK